ncbi:MAG: hypothetical protein EA394_01025 [Bacteroidia bacterium]|nr:MAG: hypothetical protein EA394_01025 [Bacteroidia bacterium]
MLLVGRRKELLLFFSCHKNTKTQNFTKWFAKPALKFCFVISSVLFGYLSKLFLCIFVFSCFSGIYIIKNGFYFHSMLLVGRRKELLLFFSCHKNTKFNQVGFIKRLMAGEQSKRTGVTY